ncbi:MAG: lipid-A-disaccharide synthase [Micavibrio aeruginosavorus]|uniref:Lipid-A-disaccharide synthase n=1 Tax=Micavibrio aeruginosavorus TaxID=349221 RepID=A0A7T5R0M5_9BACT|nr:MAG: lipid-A-disaccharide synthase [Micavibrio aeruginosavorus]
MSCDPSYYLIAGEASGDMLGARLMQALQQSGGQRAGFYGVGGSAMKGHGLKSLFPMEDLSVMGVAEVLPRLPLILSRIRQTVDDVIKKNPGLVITIDSPDFSFRVAKGLREAGYKGKMVHYVAPTVWAWRAERAKKVAALYDGILCLLPFEPGYFTREGMRAEFVGHSVLEAGWDHTDPSGVRLHYGIPANKKVLGLLFGSRVGELNRIGPVIREAALILAREIPDLHIVSVTLAHVEKLARNLLQEIPCGVTVVNDPLHKFHAFSAMDSAIATSGTVGLELAVAGVPHVIAYRMNPLTHALVRPKITAKYAHLVNILLNYPLVPEFIQKDCRPENLAKAAGLYLRDYNAVTYQKEGFRSAMHLIQGNHGGTPSQQAAAFIQSLAA